MITDESDISFFFRKPIFLRADIARSRHDIYEETRCQDAEDESDYANVQALFVHAPDASCSSRHVRSILTESEEDVFHNGLFSECESRTLNPINFLMYFIYSKLYTAAIVTLAISLTL